jgi:hypothetical protein
MTIRCHVIVTCIHDRFLTDTNIEHRSTKNLTPNRERERQTETDRDRDRQIERERVSECVCVGM